MAELLVKDETAGGDILNEIVLQIDKERITVRDIIITRVSSEVSKYNEYTSEYFKGFVSPKGAEQTQNGFKLKKHQSIDPEEQIFVALDAFQKNGFFLLVDDIQCEDLDQEVLVQPDTSVSFVKLTPLVGG